MAHIHSLFLAWKSHLPFRMARTLRIVKIRRALLPD
jgi:hypothetical protein